MEALKEREPETVKTIGRYTILRGERSFFVRYENVGGLSGSIPFGTLEEAEQYARKRTAKPLWQMEARHKLGLSPDKSDAVSMLLWGAIYGSRDQADCEARIENHIEELRRALAALKGER